VTADDVRDLDPSVLAHAEQTQGVAPQVEAVDGERLNRPSPRKSGPATTPADSRRGVGVAAGLASVLVMIGSFSFGELVLDRRHHRRPVIGRREVPDRHDGRAQYAPPRICRFYDDRPVDDDRTVLPLAAAPESIELRQLRASSRSPRS
jgi:hypothetical protein